MGIKEESGWCRDEIGKYIVTHWQLGLALYLVMALGIIRIFILSL